MPTAGTGVRPIDGSGGRQNGRNADGLRKHAKRLCSATISMIGSWAFLAFPGRLDPAEAFG